MWGGLRLVSGNWTQLCVAHSARLGWAGRKIYPSPSTRSFYLFRSLALFLRNLKCNAFLRRWLTVLENTFVLLGFRTVHGRVCVCGCVFSVYAVVAASPRLYGRYRMNHRSCHVLLVVAARGMAGRRPHKNKHSAV